MEFFGLKSLDNVAPEIKPMSDELRAKVQEVVDSGKTTMVTSFSGHPPYGIIEGKKLHYLNFSEEHNRLVLEGKDAWAHPENMNQVKCVAGCEVNSPIW